MAVEEGAAQVEPALDGRADRPEHEGRHRRPVGRGQDVRRPVVQQHQLVDQVLGGLVDRHVERVGEQPSVARNPVGGRRGGAFITEAAVVRDI
ncbi:MAG: hypothetical protein COZ38_07070, partial [Rhodocyclales bacterium CG_4_10_14_3_um_filter_68_10]